MRHAARARWLGGALLGALALGCASTPAAWPSAHSPLLGKDAPRFRRPLVQGGWYDVEATAGKVVVYEFFAKYCVPCQKRLPAANALVDALPEAVVVGISLDEHEGFAREQISRYRLRFPVVHDSGTVLAGRFRVQALPAAVVVGHDGKVAWVGGPAHPEQALRAAALDAEKVRQNAATVRD
jgi:peroxiredoxin